MRASEEIIIVLGGVQQLPDIPSGFTLNANGYLVKTSDGSLWVYVTELPAFILESPDYVLEAA